MSTPRPDPPYLVIAGEIRARITAGVLRPGDRVPSIRQIVRRWGVAVATATKVMATLRDEGLIETRVGSGAVVAPVRTRKPSVPGREGEPERSAHRKQLLRSAIAIADREGLDAVSMRRLAVETGVGPMSLYRYVASKEELLTRMADEVFAELDLPEPGSHGWREALELAARAQWRLCRRHLWLPGVISFTRPLLAPNMMAQTEWVLGALEHLDLPVEVRMREALTLHTLVVSMALTVADETETEQNTGVTHDGWQAAQRTRALDLLGSGRFPLLAQVSGDIASDLDGLFEYALARHLDGFAVLVGGSNQPPSDDVRKAGSGR